MKVIIAGGGTAGHINPGLTIAKHIQQKKPESKILFVGTEQGLETNLVPREGFELSLIRVMGFKRKVILQNIKAINELLCGLKDAYRVVKQFKPDIVIGTGGYVCGPVLMVAALLKIPTLIHEQNAFPGMTNRILSKFVDRVAISFKEAAKHFSVGKKIVFTGNPIRIEMLQADRAKSREKLGVANESLVVIFGGSRGAGKVNQIVAEMLNKEFQENEFKVVFSTGVGQFDSVKEVLGERSFSFAQIVPYIYNMQEVMAAADLLITRAGAMTISEIAAMGIPSILIPSPYVTANHQEHNARALELQGASVVVLEKNLGSKLLYEQIKSLLGDKEQLAKMGRNAKKIGNTTATEKIYSIILELVGNI